MKHSRLHNAFLLILTAAGLTGCVSSFAPESEHVHTYSNIWTYDENEHFHLATCEHEGSRGDSAPHTYGEEINDAYATETTYGIKRKVCSVCGYEKITKVDPHAHAYGEWIEVISASETEYGKQKRICSICGYTDLASIPKIHNHTYSEEWSYDNTKHYHVATCEHINEKKDIATHTMGAWETVTEPTETSTGLKERKCTVCDYKETDIILALPHTHKYEEGWSYDSESHYHAATCEHTDEKSNVETHKFSDWVITTNATEETEGEKQRTCSVCNYIDTDVVPNLLHEHTYSDEWSYDSENHYHAATCSHTREKIDVEAHDYDEWVVDSEPTYTEEGAKHRYCKVCDYIETESIDVIPHEHQYGSWSVEKDVTDSVVGVKTRTCNICNCQQISRVGELKYNVSNYYNGYYSPIVSWTDGEDLKNQLHDLIRDGYTGLVYDGNWETNQVADQSLTDYYEVNVVYSQINEKKNSTYSATNSYGWQREHAFCASLMTGYNTSDAVDIKNKGSGRATDFHNLFAAYGKANGSRGNKNLGLYNPENEVINTNAIYADTHADANNYEPNDCDKGRLARAIFYMGVMYSEDETSVITQSYKYKDVDDGSHSRDITVEAKYKPLKIVEDYVEYSQMKFDDFVSSDSLEAQNLRATYLASYREDTSAYNYVASVPENAADKTTCYDVLADYAKAYSDYRYNEGNFAIGNLSTLIDWNSYLVDRQEMQHNEMVCNYVHQEGSNKGKKQGNRNPFVDYPELVDYVYGSKKDEPGYLACLTPSEELLETNSDELYNYILSSHKDSYYVGDTFTKDDYTIARINKDFTISTIDYEDTTTSYTFTEADVGTKTMMVVTPTGEIHFEVKVESRGGVNACNYNFNVTKSDFSATTVSSEPKTTLSYDGTTFNVVSATDGAKVAKASGKDYAQIGTSTLACGTLTIESTDTFTYKGMSSISAVYIGLDTAAKAKYNYKIYIGDDLIASGEFSRDMGSPFIYGIDLDEPKSGKLKIELSNCTAAVYISQISVKVS